VYILKSELTDRFYVGQTENFERRFEEHNSGESRSTRSGIPWKVVYTIEFSSRSDAVRVEAQIKKRGIERYLQDIGRTG
jgi:putative endonuclease